MGRVGLADRPGLAVQACGLGARYGGRRGRTALVALDLDVARGAVVGVLGPNGAGKSTLLRLLATSLRPSAGTLTILDHDARRPTDSLRRRIGFAAAEPVHVDALTGRENAVCFARAAGLARGEAEHRTAELLEQFRLTGDADRPVAEYSLGMRRRLLLLEAFAHRPALLAFDEPTTGLDPEGRETLRGLVDERAAAGAAVVMATNDVAEAERACRRVVFLRGGRAVLEGEPADLVARLGGATRFEFRLTTSHAPQVRCDGVEIAVATAERLVGHSRDGSSPLPELCAAILRTGAAVESVEVRRPDLGDVYLRATGEELQVE